MPYPADAETMNWAEKAMTKMLARVRASIAAEYLRRMKELGPVRE